MNLLTNTIRIFITKIILCFQLGQLKHLWALFWFMPLPLLFGSSGCLPNIGLLLAFLLVALVTRLLCINWNFSQAFFNQPLLLTLETSLLLSYLRYLCISFVIVLYHVNDGFLATGEGNTEKISEFHVETAPMTSVTLVGYTVPYVMLNEKHVVAGAMLVGHCVKRNPVKRPRSPGVLDAQWLEHLTGIVEVVGSISTWNSEISLVVPSWCCQATITISNNLQ